MGIKKILIVDDEADMRVFVSTVVETMGLDPIPAQDGVEALKKARTVRPDLIVLDVMMPKIEDGIRTYHQFKTENNLTDIPIIMLSAIAKRTFFHSLRMLSPQKDEVIPEPEAYMEKPPDAEMLTGLIKSFLSIGG